MKDKVEALLAEYRAEYGFTDLEASSLMRADLLDIVDARRILAAHGIPTE